MLFVLDTSMVVSSYLNEGMSVADAVIRRLDVDRAIVTGLFWFEVRNAMLVAERRKRITVEQSDEFLVKLETLPIEIDEAPVSTMVMRLARTHGLTAYDAGYLELASRRRLPLATFDSALLRAARTEGVMLLVN
jgi:predicted nucleic acid-binding protein